MGQQIGEDYISSFEGDEIDEILTKADTYPAASSGTDGDVPVLRGDAFVLEPQSGGGNWQAQIVYQEITLLASSWSNNTQTVPVPGVLADETAQLIQPVPASVSRAVYDACAVKATEQAADSLTFQAATVPDNDLTVFVVISSVKAGQS